MSGTISLDGLLRTLAPVASAPRWWIALSGGLDSSVLLHALHSARARDSSLPPLAALHINHQLHPAADDWQRNCEALCQSLAVPLHSERVTVRVGGQGLEAAAREARHRVFAARLAGAEVLLSAHHQDDQVETLLLRLMRGAGLAGLGAMAVSRPLGAGLLYRPLLDVPRAALQHYAQSHGLSPVEDPSNLDTRLDRNYLRHRVLPLLEARWPGYRQTVSRAALQLQEAAEQLREQLPPVPPRRSAMGDAGLALEPLRALPAAQAAAVLRDWLLSRAGATAPDRAALLEFLRQLRESGETGRPRLDCGQLSLQRYRDGVYLLPEPRDWQAPVGLTLAAGAVRRVPGVGQLALVPTRGRGLALAPGETLSLRWRSGGERCRAPGCEGSRSLKKLLQARGVPPWWRERIPLFYLGEELLAVGDLWLCESPRVQQSGQGWQVRWQRNSPAPT
jgi:tRNA(Ile)-lysidine synthase